MNVIPSKPTLNEAFKEFQRLPDWPILKAGTAIHLTENDTREENHAPAARKPSSSFTPSPTEQNRADNYARIPGDSTPLGRQPPSGASRPASEVARSIELLPVSSFAGVCL